MFIWIFRHLSFISLIFVTGCGDGRFASTGGIGTTTKAARDITVTPDSIVISGPPGYCVDPSSSQGNAVIPFVVMGNCAAISRNSRDAQPAYKAVLTASVGDVGSGDALMQGGDDLLTEFFWSDEGRQTLSRSGDPSQLELLDSFISNDIYFIHTNDTSRSMLLDISPEEWRAYFDVRGRLISLAVLGFADAPLLQSEGKALIMAFAAEVQQRTAAASGPLVVNTSQTQSMETVDLAPQRPPAGTVRTLDQVGLLRRILG